jgi:hypothetical protein
MNIFDYCSDGNDENTGRIINSPIFVPRPLVLYYSISYACSISS